MRAPHATKSRSASGYIGQSYHVPISIVPDGIATLTANEAPQSVCSDLPRANTVITTMTFRSSL